MDDALRRKDPFDVLFLGSSEAYCSFIPMEIWGEYGITSYVCSTPAQRVYQSVEYLRSAFRTQRPRIVVMVALLVLKLQPLTGMEFMAPLGISYFTLQIISYHVDVYRGKYEPERNLLRYGLLVTYLPHIFLGPIERYDKMVQALFEQRHIDWDGVSSGGARLLWGLFKKLVIAARAGVIVSAVSGDPEQFRGAYALAAMLLYAVQLYADFSGGIDLVLGVSRMLGIRLSVNI